MLRITIKESADTVTFVLEGKFRGPWVEEVEQCWQEALPTQDGKTLCVDLAKVGFVDRRGKDLLGRMSHDGVKLMAVGPMMTSLVEEIAGHPPHVDNAETSTEGELRQGGRA